MTHRVAVHLRTGIVLAPVVIALVVVLAAIVEAALASVHPTLDGPATLAAWQSAASDDAVRESVTFTLAIASSSAVLATLVALVAYLAIRRSRTAWVWVLVLLPALLPHIVAGLVVVAWVGPGGVMDRILDARPVELYRDALGAGTVLAYTWKESAFVLMLLLAGAPRDLRAREEMARVCGLNYWQTLRSVTLPALARAASVGCVTVLVFAVGALEIPALLGPTSPQTLAAATVDAMALDVLAGQSTAAALAISTTALASLLAVMLLGATAAARSLQRRGLRRTVSSLETGAAT